MAEAIDSCATIKHHYQPPSYSAANGNSAARKSIFNRRCYKLKGITRNRDLIASNIYNTVLDIVDNSSMVSFERWLLISFYLPPNSLNSFRLWHIIVILNIQWLTLSDINLFHKFFIDIVFIIQHYRDFEKNLINRNLMRIVVSLRHVSPKFIFPRNEKI